MNVYELVTSRIVERLEAGVIPWRKCWTSGPAKSANRQRIANLLPTARRLLFVVSDRQRIADSRARPIRPLGFRDGSSAPPAVSNDLRGQPPAAATRRSPGTTNWPLVIERLPGALRAVPSRRPAPRSAVPRSGSTSGGAGIWRQAPRDFTT